MIPATLLIKDKLTPMKKTVLIFLCTLLSSGIFAQQKAFDVIAEARKKASAKDAMTYIQKSAESNSALSEKRALFAFLGSLQEQLGFFEQAEKSFVTAAGISASDAEKMTKKTNEQLVLDAVRCALNYGNYSSAESYLNSAVRNSKDQTIQSYIKLYAVWSSLCRANDGDDLEEPLALLAAYSTVSSMKEVHPAVLMTLWYITGESFWAEEIITRYPTSPECAIVKGDSQLMPSPFWYFVPKTGEAKPGTGTVKENKNVETAKIASEEKPVSTSENKSGKTKLQLGLFSSMANAKALVEELKDKGFDAYILSDKKPSGNTYYTVLIDETDNTIADRLRSNGYECYLVN